MKPNVFYRHVLILSLTGYLWLAWNLLDIARTSFPTMCIIKELCGIPCPSCGTTRALMTLVQGNYVEAVLLNPFAMVVGAGLIILPIWVAADLLRRRCSFLHFYRSLELFFPRHKWVPVVGAAVVLLNWAWNITKGL